MRAIFIASVLGSFLSAAAVAAPRDVWQASDNDAHYFLHDYRTNEYKETIDCRVSYTFTLSEERAEGLLLYDASRSLYVFLKNGSMWLWLPNATQWTLFKKGAFDRRSYFHHYDATGGVSGFFVKKNGCMWEEHFDGTGNAAFRFGQQAADPSSITLYDNSRGMYVRLDASSMWLRLGMHGSFSFYKNGSWD